MFGAYNDNSENVYGVKSMDRSQLLAFLEKHGQEHILRHIYHMDGSSSEIFTNHLMDLDLPLVFELHRTFSGSVEPVKYGSNIGPAQVVTIPRTENEKRFEKQARSAGQELIRAGRVAVLIVAGGQGSRLGFDGPKGTFRISPIRGKALFQLFAEQIIALSRQYSVSIPLFLMTSEDNHEQTVEFFESNAYFGLSSQMVRFFRQDVLPAITPSGKLVMRNDTALFTNPNGHGGSLKAIYDSGVLSELLKQGFTDLYYCQIDNPLVKIADPVFLGYHTIAQAQVSTKLVRRRNIEEKVGVYVSYNGKDAIVEYSDLSPEYMSALDQEGKIKYWAGNTAIHVFSIPFIDRLNNHGFALPYHCAKKNADTIDLNGIKTSTDVWKFETFVFDAIPLAEKTCGVEIDRDEEFSPLKNKEGSDSPETARSAIVDLHKRWLRKTGVEVSDKAIVEISPLFANDAEELAERIVEQNITPVRGDTYFGE